MVFCRRFQIIQVFYSQLLVQNFGPFGTYPFDSRDLFQIDRQTAPEFFIVSNLAGFNKFFNLFGNADADSGNILQSL